jgi:hypothetical protein
MLQLPFILDNVSARHRRREWLSLQCRCVLGACGADSDADLHKMIVA